MKINITEWDAWLWIHSELPEGCSFQRVKKIQIRKQNNRVLNWYNKPDRHVGIVITYILLINYYYYNFVFRAQLIVTHGHIYE